MGNNSLLPNRRTLLGAGGSGLLGLLLTNCSATAPDVWSQHQFYKYRVRLEVDGKPYELSNGGILAVARGTFASSPCFDLALPAVQSLPTGELIVAFPPSLGGEFQRRYPGDGVRLQSLPYPSEMFPSIFIFDDASKPTRVEAYVMRAALTGETGRVKLIALENEVMSTDQRVSISRKLPWYAASESALRVWTEKGSDALHKYVTANSTQFAQDIFGPCAVAPALYSWIAILGPTKYTRPRDPWAQAPAPLKGFSGSHLEIGQSLAAGESVQLPLNIVGGPIGELTWASDPRVFICTPVNKAQQDWAISHAYPHSRSADPSYLFALNMRYRFSGAGLGSLNFHRDTTVPYRWLSSDGEWHLDVQILRPQLVEFGVAGSFGRSYHGGPFTVG